MHECFLWCYRFLLRSMCGWLGSFLGEIGETRMPQHRLRILSGSSDQGKAKNQPKQKWVWPPPRENAGCRHPVTRMSFWLLKVPHKRKYQPNQAGSDKWRFPWCLLYSSFWSNLRGSQKTVTPARARVQWLAVNPSRKHQEKSRKWPHSLIPHLHVSCLHQGQTEKEKAIISEVKSFDYPFEQTDWGCVLTPKGVHKSTQHQLEFTQSRKTICPTRPFKRRLEENS